MLSRLLCGQSGSYQKLYYHPQTDSPVWNIEFARRDGEVPLLASCCASGSLRVAPAKRLFRATQHSVELFRLSGERDTDVNKPYKLLTASFDRKIVAEPPSPPTREFCERDAALHRLRVSTSAVGASPCFIAAGGHAGLVVVLELQEALDNILRDHFLPASRKLGRPRKASDPWSSASKAKGKPLKTTVGTTAGSKKAAAAGGKLVKSKKMRNALTKYKTAPGALKTGRRPRAGSISAGFIVGDADGDAVEASSHRLDVSEGEYVDDGEEEEEEDESISSRSLVAGDDMSEDDRGTISSDAVEEETTVAHETPERARMMAEYQMDLPEEDAIMLAIQMSEMEQQQPSPAPNATTKGTGTAKAKAKPAGSTTATSSADKKSKSAEKSKRKQASPIVAQKKLPKAKLAGGEATIPSTAPVAKKATKIGTGASGVSAASPSAKPVKSGRKAPQPKKAAGKASGGKGSKPTPKYDGYMDQVATLQIIQFQNGMTEEDALQEALRLSEAEAKRSVSGVNDADATASSTTTATEIEEEVAIDSLELKTPFATPSATKAMASTPSTGKAGSLEPVAATRAPPARANAKAVTKRPASAAAAKKPRKIPAPKAVKRASASIACVATSESSVAPSEELTKGEEEAEAASSESLEAAAASASSAKRKRLAKPAPARKRVTKDGKSVPGSSSSGGATHAKGGDMQEASGYLTDEEALYLALRASEVEY